MVHKRNNIAAVATLVVYIAVPICAMEPAKCAQLLSTIKSSLEQPEQKTTKRTHQETPKQRIFRECNYPGCTFKTTWRCSLGRHKKTHSLQKDYVCGYPDCSYATNQKTNLTRHQTTQQHIPLKKQKLEQIMEQADESTSDSDSYQIRTWVINNEGTITKKDIE
jgi:uncharacterized Zn-finger protein